MATLKAEHKTFIVAAIARFQTPSEVAAGVKAEFGLDIDRQQVRFYNPQQNAACPQMWVDLFESERRNFLDDRSRIGVSNLAFRQLVRQRLLQRELDSPRPNVILVLDIIKQAAMDEGDAFSAKRDDKGAAPVASPNIEAAIFKVYGQNPDEQRAG